MSLRSHPVSRRAVPNVSGHLSFNLIDPQSKYPTYNHQEQLDQPRAVAVHRERLAQDFPFPDWAVKRFRSSARQDFILLAESGRVLTPYFRDGKLDHSDDAHGVLAGVVAVLPAASDAATKEHIECTLAQVDDIVLDAATEKATSGIDPARCLPREVLDILEVARDRLACYFLRFALYRTGELRIWYDLDEFLGRDLATEPANELEKVAARHIAPQAYYFIKDLLHAHYHHKANSDQFLPLVATPRPADDAAHQANEVDWRYAPLRGLTRVVVELRQGRSVAGHQRAKGIIAYAQSFQSVLAHVTRPRESDQPCKISDKIIPYDFANLTMSLDATDARTQSSVSAQLQLFGIIVGILLSGLALWAGAVQIQPQLCQSLGADICPKIRPGPVVSLVNWVVANPSTFLGILVTAGVIAFAALFRGLNAIPGVEVGIRWLRQLAEAIGTQIARGSKDWIGWLFSLAVLGGLATGIAIVAIRLAPSTPVPPVATRPLPRGPWASLYPMVGQRAEHSRLLVSSVIVPHLPALLEDDYGSFLGAFSQDAKLARDGDLLVLTSTATVGGDGAYLLIDPRTQRLEAGVRRDGELKVHRTQGASLPRPAQIIQLLGAAGRSDSGQVPVETTVCNSTQGGTTRRSLQLSGSLRVDQFCEYSVELQQGQSLTFDRKGAKGLDVQLVNKTGTRSIGYGFTSDRNGKQLVRVVWQGWNPPPQDRLKPRKFYVRLTIH